MHTNPIARTDLANTMTVPLSTKSFFPSQEQMETRTVRLSTSEVRKMKAVRAKAQLTISSACTLNLCFVSGYPVNPSQ